MVTFTEHTTIDFADFALSTADISAVDLDGSLAPCAWPSKHRGRRIVFSSDRDPSRTGLFVSRAF